MLRRQDSSDDRKLGTAVESNVPKRRRMPRKRICRSNPQTTILSSETKSISRSKRLHSSLVKYGKNYAPSMVINPVQFSLRQSCPEKSFYPRCMSLYHLSLLLGKGYEFYEPQEEPGIKCPRKHPMLQYPKEVSFNEDCLSFHHLAAFSNLLLETGGTPANTPRNMYVEKSFFSPVGSGGGLLSDSDENEPGQPLPVTVVTESKSSSSKSKSKSKSKSESKSASLDLALLGIECKSNESDMHKVMKSIELFKDSEPTSDEYPPIGENSSTYYPLPAVSLESSDHIRKFVQRVHAYQRSLQRQSDISTGSCKDSKKSSSETRDHVTSIKPKTPKIPKSEISSSISRSQLEHIASKKKKTTQISQSETFPLLMKQDIHELGKRVSLPVSLVIK